MSMPSSRTLFLALCCAGILVLAAGAVAAGDIVTQDAEPDEAALPPEMISVDNSSNYLSATTENVTHERYEPVGIDVAVGIETDATRLQGTHERRSLERALSIATGDTVEREMVASLEREAERLETRQRTLIEEYNTGLIGASTVLSELVRVEVTAEQYRELIETVDQEGTTSEGLDTRYSNLQAEVPFFPSEMASHLEAEFTRGGMTPVYIQSGSESLVVATMDGGTVIREALLFDQHAPDEPEVFGTNDHSPVRDAADRVDALYPWVMANTSPQIVGFGNTSVYHFDTSHPHGEIQSYIDGATTNAFYETQQKNALAVSMAGIEQETEDGLRLSVEYNEPTGPMLVDVRQAGDSSATDIDLYVDGNHVGNVGEGGDIWTIQPTGSFEVTALAETGDSVSVTVSLFP